MTDKLIAKLDEYFQVAELHVARMNSAKNKIKELFPLDTNKLQNLDEDQVMIIDFYNLRFTKLQDLLGAKIFPAILELNGEDIKTLFYIDILNKIEKLEIILDSQEWNELRKLRNHFTCEYPNNPQKLIDNLNNSFQLDTELFQCLEKAKKPYEYIKSQTLG